MSVIGGLRWYYDLCGMRGVCAAASFRSIGWPREFTVVPRGMDHPVRLRLGTSDFCAYKDVLVCRSKEYEPAIANFSPRVIVDAGAHIGMASLGFARRYPLATIYAVEPEPANFALLVQNVRAYRRIVPLQAAIWNQDGEVCLGPSAAHPKGAFQVVESSETRVRAITLGTLLREMKIDMIDLLKIDIEGAEKEVFESCDWIEKVGTIAIELHDRVKPGCGAAVRTVAKSFRFEERGDVTFCFSEVSRARERVSTLREAVQATAS